MSRFTITTNVEDAAVFGNGSLAISASHEWAMRQTVEHSVFVVRKDFAGGTAWIIPVFNYQTGAFIGYLTDGE